MTNNDTKPPPIPQEETALAPRQTPRFPALEIDYALYEKMLEGSEWTDVQKREFIETMWSIIVQFVDLGFGVHPLQQACEQEFDLSPTLDSIAVNSEQILPENEFENAVCPPVETQTRRIKT